jgi:hypothetical protein
VHVAAAQPGARGPDAGWEDPTRQGPEVGWPDLPEPADDAGSDPARVLVPYNGTAIADTALEEAVRLGRAESAVA